MYIITLLLNKTLNNKDAQYVHVHNWMLYNTSNIFMHENDIFFQDYDNFAPKMFIDKNSMHKDISGKFPF